MILQKITPFLWFDGEAEAAAKFYTALFPKSKIVKTARYEAAGAAASGRRKGSVMIVTFRLNGQEFIALNGGPQFKFTEAVSFVVHCESQGEVDHFWKKLSAGGKKSECGWLKDKFGLSWQIVPRRLPELLGGRDPVKTQRVMQALLQMSKLDIKKLQAAYEGRV
jgi:predicted 3-demethylubiquinone-9 3-methyltransferase (glyoxalase superfamily)